MGFAAIIDAFGGPLSFSREIGIPASHARAMKTRNSIAPRYWPVLISKARDRGMYLTEEMLVAIYARRWPRASGSEAA
jgi:hypothetical protein